jgi:pyruvate kinase
MSLCWGVETIYYGKFGPTDETIEEVISIAEKERRVRKGDIVINTASMPLHWKGVTNMLKISIVE